MSTRLFISFVIVFIALIHPHSVFGYNCFTNSDFKKSCSHFDSPHQFCNTATGVCADYTTSTLGNAAGNTVQCVESGGSKSLRVNDRCKKLLAKGCSLTNANTQACSTANPNNGGVCSSPTTTNVVGAGQQCGGSSGKVCGYNLFCNSERVCEVAVPLGERCTGSSYSQCVEGAICERGHCIVKYSQKYGEPCETDNACDTGACSQSTMKCTFTNTKKECLRDGDCNSLYSVCVGSDGVSKFGKCSTNYFASQRDYSRCIAESCTVSYGKNGYDSECGAKKCNKEFTQFYCSKGCSFPPSHRVELTQEYSFNCDSFVATAWSSFSSTDRCQISEQFSSCDAEVFNRLPSFASVNTLAFGVLAFFAFTLVLLL